MLGRRKLRIYILYIMGGMFLIYCVFEVMKSTSGAYETDSSSIRHHDKYFKDVHYCKMPYLPIVSNELKRFFHSPPPIRCHSAGRNWVTCNRSSCSISKHIKKDDDITCTINDILRENDFISTSGPKTLLRWGDVYQLKASDVVRVNCWKQTKSLFSIPITWAATLIAIRNDTVITMSNSWNQMNNEAVKMNVLMIGFDSLSRNTFQRKLPLTYAYLVDVLGVHIFEGYNIVGDGTPQAIIPILTGKTETELPDTRRRYRNTNFVDIYPLIWNEYKSAGYVTAFFEDLPHSGTFTYRLRGFNNCPTDHYMRTYYVAASAEQRKWPPYCAGDTPRHQVMFDQIENFYKIYEDQPKFLFAFHGELSHDDYNLIEAADSDIKKMFMNLHDSAALENTILIVFADHGHRFADIRNTVQGKLEERLPFMGFVLPSRFREQYTSAYNNFLNNKDKLVTPFDIHATLKKFLKFDAVTVANLSQRAVSLFDKIPNSRHCGHAGIDPHWCTCLQWSDASKGPLGARLVAKFISSINIMTKPYRKYCETLVAKRVLSVDELLVNKQLLSYKKAASYDGYKGDFSHDMKASVAWYQIKVETIPGGGLFEASLSYDVKTDRISIQERDISRINVYGKQARCLKNEWLHLRKYCYCKDGYR